MRRTSLAVAGLLIAALAAAQLARYKDWAKSPEAYFLTPEERAEWSRIGNDTDAEKFIASYWAKRGGERFKAEVQRRIAAADEQFKLRRQRGAESSRGRLLITLGGPSRVSRSRVGGGTGEATPDLGPPAGGPPPSSPFGAGSGETVIQTWIYEKDKFDPSWGIGEIQARILIDPQRGTDELQSASAVDRAIAKIAEKSIVNPTPAAGAAQAVPSVPALAGAGPAGAPAAPPAPVAAALPAAARASLETILKERKEEPRRVPVFWGGAFRTFSGDPFYAFQFYFEGEKAPAGPVKFGGIVSGQSGGEVAAFWEDATFADMKTGSKTDKVFERSLVLPIGSYRAAFGLFPSDGSAAIESAPASIVLEAKPSDFEMTSLILTNELKPLTKRPAPTDPFVFGVEKPIKVEPKADRTFSRQDSLWYFYAINNPKLPEGSASSVSTAAPPAPQTAPTPGAAPAPAAEAPKPRILQRIGVLKDGKPAFAPFSGTAEMQLLAPGYYASGSEIPLATFEPGFYTFTLNVRDLNAPRDSAAFKGVDRQADFIVLKPDGTLPERAAPKPAVAPTARPRPKKG